MSEQTPVEVIQPASYASSSQQGGNTALKVIAVILIVLILCCCCSFLIVFAGLWAGLGWLWNNGDALFQIGNLMPFLF
jgi:hypothetical protein